VNAGGEEKSHTPSTQKGPDTSTDVQEWKKKVIIKLRGITVLFEWGGGRNSVMGH